MRLAALPGLLAAVSVLGATALALVPLVVLLLRRRLAPPLLSALLAAALLRALSEDLPRLLLSTAGGLLLIGLSATSSLVTLLLVAFDVSRPVCTLLWRVP